MNAHSIHPVSSIDHLMKKKKNNTAPKVIINIESIFTLPPPHPAPFPPFLPPFHPSFSLPFSLCGKKTERGGGGEGGKGFWEKRKKNTKNTDNRKEYVRRMTMVGKWKWDYEEERS